MRTKKPEQISLQIRRLYIQQELGEFAKLKVQVKSQFRDVIYNTRPLNKKDMPRNVATRVHVSLLIYTSCSRIKQN